ncbi:MAG TPA: CNNM domain-containing protein, partial [Acidimicrobiia bacterium]|nr:CNNM domain-containing protein [Acidimicrobiia bacterium]
MSVIAMVAAALLIVVGAWLRAAGTAISRLPRADALRDASDGVKGAEGVAELLDRRENITPAVGVVASAFLVAASVVATAVLSQDMSIGRSLLMALGVGMVAFMAGDLIPRRLGRFDPAGLSYRSSRVLEWSVRLGGWANDLLPEVDNGVEEEDVDEEGEADEHERELIDSVL